MTDPKPMTPEAKPLTTPVHNHGPEEGKGLVCREQRIAGRLVGECIEPLTDAYRLKTITLDGDVWLAKVAECEALREAVERLTQDRTALIDGKVQKRQAWMNEDGSVSFVPRSEPLRRVDRWVVLHMPAQNEAEYYRFTTSDEALDAARRPSPEDTKK